MPRSPDADTPSQALIELIDRVTELELRYMEQAAELESLDEVIREQDARIAALEAALHGLIGQLAEPDLDEEPS